MRLNSLTLIIIYLVVLIGVGLIVPVETDWSAKYGSEHKDPLGTYILYKQLADLFEEGGIQRSIMPLYNYLNSVEPESGYIIMNDEFNPDRLDVERLLTFVGEGGNVFISAEHIGDELLDTLGVVVDEYYGFTMPFFQDSSKIPIRLQKVNDSTIGVELNELLQGSKFSTSEFKDSIEYETLGFREDEVNFIRLGRGDGNIYLHLCPAVFSNYALLHLHSSPYVSAVLNYLPKEDVVFDDYYKAGKAKPRGTLAVLFSQPAMRWSWNLALFSVVLFMIFGARRKTRVIPVVEPYENDSLLFIETIADMHFQRREYLVIAEKRLNNLIHNVNSKFHINKTDWMNQNVELISVRTGIEIEKWQSVLNRVDLKLKPSLKTVEELQMFSEAIDELNHELKL